MRVWRILSILLVFSGALAAQNFGGNPPGQRWRQIKSPNVRVIYPAGLQKPAQRVAGIIDQLQATGTRSIGLRLEPIDMVLQMQTTVANGYVQLLPYRSELFGTPLQDYHRLGTTDWLDLLAIHEYRHVQQYSNARQGVTRLASYLFGQGGWLALANVTVPDWFFEGDAVVAETAFTQSGRGRTPFFSIEQRALFQAGRDYTYMKARNGSFKDLVPNHYRLGYTLTSYAREQFGNDIWKNVYKNAVRYEPLFYSFSGALKRETGLTPPKLYQQSYAAFAANYRDQLAKLALTPTETLLPRTNKTLTHYRWPHPQPDGSVVALRNSNKQTERLVRIQDGKEEVLTEVGFQTEPYLSVAGNRAIWMEFEQDPRWYNRSYSVLVMYDFRTKVKFRLSQKTRLFAPKLDREGKQIVAVEFHPATGSRIQVLAAGTGQLLQQLENPEALYISYPTWSAEADRIYFIGQRNSELAFFEQSLEAGAAPQRLSEWTTSVLSHPHVGSDGAIYYSGSRSGIDNIFRFDPETKTTQQLTSLEVGGYMPCLSSDGQRLYLSEFTHLGFDITHLPLTTARSKRRITPRLAPHFATGAPVAEGGDILRDFRIDTAYTERFYRGISGIQLHSWVFTGNLSVPGMEILVDNVLNDFRASLGASYNLNEDRFSYRGALTYAGWFPWITLDASLRQRSTSFLTEVNDSLRFIPQEFQQLDYGLQGSIPLRWVQGNYRTTLQPSLGYSQYRLSNYESERALADDQFGVWRAGLTTSFLRRMAIQQVQPRVGALLLLDYRRTATSGLGERFYARGQLFLPGLAPTHGIRLDWDYQQEPIENQFQFPDVFGYPRGYPGLAHDRIVRLGVNYQLPLLYPDWGFGGITYFRRVRATLFFDAGERFVDVANFSQQFQSTGIELRFDNRWLNVANITLGVRASYLLDTFGGALGNTDFQFIIEGDLSQ